MKLNEKAENFTFNIRAKCAVLYVTAWFWVVLGAMDFVQCSIALLMNNNHTSCVVYNVKTSSGDVWILNGSSPLWQDFTRIMILSKCHLDNLNGIQHDSFQNH